MKKLIIFFIASSFLCQIKGESMDKTTEQPVFVLLAGGSGERLWPLSRKERPKQLIPFLGNKSLLEQTIDRIQSLVSDKKNLIVLTNQQQSPAVTQLVGKHVGTVMAEPASRNTGPAILYACESKEISNDPILVFLPSDHFIPDTQKFCSSLQKTIDYASKHDVIALLGLMPTFPATGYGYIQAKVSHENCYPVQKFHEKPTLDIAEQYIRRNDMFWNIGIFIARQSVLLKEFQEHAPELFSGMQSYLTGQKSFEKLPDISIDYAVMEKSSRIVMLPADFEWHDVGNIKTFLDIKAKYGNNEVSRVITHDGQNNSAMTNKKLVACVGVSDVCIIETDDVILVVAKDRVEQVKKVLGKIKEQGL